MVEVDRYRKKSLAFEETMDHKPKGKKTKQVLRKSGGKQHDRKEAALEQELMAQELELSLQEALAKEQQDALDCELYGPCKHCRMKEME